MRRAALLFLALGSPAILVAFVIGGTIGEWLFVSISLIFPTALIVLGAGSQNRAAQWIAALLGVLLLGGGGAVLWLSRGATRAVWAGLPVAGWLVLLLLGLFPLLLTGMGYAIAFRDAGRGPAGGNDGTGDGR